MEVVQLNKNDLPGRATRIAYRLHKSRQSGYGLFSDDWSPYALTLLDQTPACRLQRLSSGHSTTSTRGLAAATMTSVATETSPPAAGVGRSAREIERPLEAVSNRRKGISPVTELINY